MPKFHPDFIAKGQKMLKANGGVSLIELIQKKKKKKIPWFLSLDLKQLNKKTKDKVLHYVR